MQPKDLRSHAFLLLPLFACNPGTDGHRADEAHDLAPFAQMATPAMTVVDPLAFDLVHRTCALYVAIRSGALKAEVAFGRDFDQDMVRWNHCPGGTMVACATAPGANGDTVRTGIHWPYQPVSGL